MKISAKRMRLAGHCQRIKEVPAGTLALWIPRAGQGHRSQCGAGKILVNTLKTDTEAKRTEEIVRWMEDQDG